VLGWRGKIPSRRLGATWEIGVRSETSHTYARGGKKLAVNLLGRVKIVEKIKKHNNKNDSKSQRELQGSIHKQTQPTKRMSPWLVSHSKRKVMEKVIHDTHVTATIQPNTNLEVQSK
jgi:hypothetical protein